MYYLDVLFIIRLYKIYLFIAGIGAGVESMTMNQMAWDGDVNPKVYLFLFILFVSEGLLMTFLFWLFIHLDWILTVILIMAAKEFSKSPRLPSTHGCYFRECCTSFRCDKAGAGSGGSRRYCSAMQYIAKQFVFINILKLLFIG